MQVCILFLCVCTCCVLFLGWMALQKPKERWAVCDPQSAPHIRGDALRIDRYLHALRIDTCTHTQRLRAQRLPLGTSYARTQAVPQPDVVRLSSPRPFFLLLQPSGLLGSSLLVSWIPPRDRRQTDRMEMVVRQAQRKPGAHERTHAEAQPAAGGESPRQRFSSGPFWVVVHPERAVQQAKQQQSDDIKQRPTQKSSQTRKLAARQ